jgi:hypothetical protein
MIKNPQPTSGSPTRPEVPVETTGRAWIRDSILILPADGTGGVGEFGRR